MRIRTVISLVLSFALLCVASAEAAVDLSVTPISGGNSLRFGRVSLGSEVSKEVRVRVTSTDGKQYQVFARLADPFVNEKNVPLGHDTLVTYTLRGSNASGTLYAQTVERMGPSDQLLYTSASGGESDSFTVAYTVKSDQIRAAGNFFGRVQYTVRSIGGAGQQDVILNMSLEVSGGLKISVEGSSNADTVRLRLKGDRDREGFINLGFTENIAGEVKVFQSVEIFPQDALFKPVNEGLVLFVVSGSTKGELSPGVPTALTRKETLIYASQANEDTFYVNLILDESVMDRQKAGAYRGKLKYVVQAGDDRQEKIIDLEVEVDPTFTMDVDLPAGGLRFERLLPDSQPVLREVTVRVKTNLGRPYMVSQNIASLLTSQSGAQMAQEYFTMKMEPLGGQPGKVLYDDYRPVAAGDHPIFTSDSQGSPSHFKVTYRLRPFAEMAPGDYSTSIRFSLGEI